MSEVKIVIIKIVSGQEVLGKLVSESDDYIVVNSPVTIQPTRDAKGDITVGILPFSWGGVANSVILSKQNILCILDAEDKLALQYSAGLAGLTVPTNTPKITL